MKTLTMCTVAATLACAAPALAEAAKPAPAVPSAQQQCKTERAGMGVQAFALTYGTNANRSNAFGKCVSKRNALTHAADKAQRAAVVAAQTTADVNAAKACWAERKADAAAFTAKYGGKRNAFGKCVSTTAKA
jgi:hypothetical protein